MGTQVNPVEQMTRLLLWSLCLGDSIVFRVCRMLGEQTAGIVLLQS